jgi:hypothetical protein
MNSTFDSASAAGGARQANVDNSQVAAHTLHRLVHRPIDNLTVGNGTTPEAIIGAALRQRAGFDLHSDFAK